MTETKKMQKFKKGDTIRLNIKYQGAPIVNSGHVREIGKNIVALEIDLKSKYCKVSHSFSESGGACGVYISATKESLRLNEKVNRTEPTAIEFIDFIGWDIFSDALGRYTLRVCLVRNELKK